MEDPHQPIRLPVSDVLDLHMVPARDAQAVTAEFLLEARAHGFPGARIIHGKGIGVQREMVRTLLKGLPFVEHFSDAPPEAGGWGATVVTFTSQGNSKTLITMKPLPVPSDELVLLRKQYDDILADAESLAASVSGEAFNRPPQPGAWSVGQCLEHLNQIDGMYARLAAEAITAGRRDRIFGTGPFHYSWLQRYFLRKTEPPASFRVKAPKVFAPPPVIDPQKCMEQFRRTNRELVRLTVEAEGLDLKRIRVQSPVSRWLTWSLGIVLLVCAAHDRRHLYQARQVLERIR